MAKNKVDKNTWGLVLMDRTSKLHKKLVTRYESSKGGTKDEYNKSKTL